MLFTILLTTATFAQVPTVCATECQSVQQIISECTTTTTPKSSTQWTEVTKAMATCICPKLLDSNCSQCLILKAPSESIYFNQLQGACTKGDADLVIKSLWDVKKDVQNVAPILPTVNGKPVANAQGGALANGIAHALSIVLISMLFY